MFSRTKINDSAQGNGSGQRTQDAAGDTSRLGQHLANSGLGPKPKPGASVLSSDLTVKGNIKTTGDIRIEGVVEGDVHAHLLTIGENAKIKGEVVADDIVVNGRIIGLLRGLKVRLLSTARVEGDIIHKTIAIESGANFEGSVQRQEDPLGRQQQEKPAPASASERRQGRADSSSSSSSSSSSQDSGA